MVLVCIEVIDFFVKILIILIKLINFDFFIWKRKCSVLYDWIIWGCKNYVGLGEYKIGREFRCNKFDYFNFFKIVCLLLRVLKGFDREL